MQLKKVRLPNGETYAYREAGQGNKVLVLIHGNMSSSLWWDVLIEELKDEDKKIYAIDLRGFGESSYNNPIKSINDLTLDIKLFADAVGISGFTIAGLSLGGSVAMGFTVDYPEYVSKLILIAPGPARGIRLHRRDAAGQIIPGEYVDSKKDIEEYNRHFLNYYATRNYSALKKAYDEAVWNVNKPDPKRYQAYIEESCKQRCKIDVDWAVINYNISHEHNGFVAGSGEVDRITCPVLVLIGDKDKAITMEMAKSTVKDIGENARLIVMPETAHAPFEDSLDLIADEIRKFV